MDEYKLEFSYILCFASEGYRDNERMKVQKFQSRLNPEIRHNVKMFELTTLTVVVHKVRVVESTKVECKKQQQQQAPQSQFLGKRPSYTSPYVRSFGHGASSKGKKPKYVKPL